MWFVKMELPQILTKYRLFKTGLCHTMPRMLGGLLACVPITRGGGGTPIHYLYGYVPPKGVVILKLLI